MVGQNDPPRGLNAYVKTRGHPRVKVTKNTHSGIKGPNFDHFSLGKLF